MSVTMREHPPLTNADHGTSPSAGGGSAAGTAAEFSRVSDPLTTGSPMRSGGLKRLNACGAGLSEVELDPLDEGRRACNDPVLA
jgi:hypothetical protein